MLVGRPALAPFPKLACVPFLGFTVQAVRGRRETTAQLLVLLGRLRLGLSCQLLVFGFPATAQLLGLLGGLGLCLSLRLLMFGVQAAVQLLGFLGGLRLGHALGLLVFALPTTTQTLEGTVTAVA